MANMAQIIAVATKPFTATSWVLFLIRWKGMDVILNYKDNIKRYNCKVKDV
jgi:hypothetical protein